MRICLILLLLLNAAFANAQKDAAAEPYLEQLAKDLNPGHALNIEFDYIREDQQAQATVEGSGTLVLMGEKYRIDLGEAVIWYDGEKQYSLNKDIEEVYISIPDAQNKESMFTDPLTLLRNYKHEFKYRLMGEGIANGISVTEVQLYPEELGGPYALIKLFFTTGKKKLQSMVIRHKEGVLYTMKVTEMDRMDDPGDEFFRFSEDEYPNVDIIELLN